LGLRAYSQSTRASTRASTRSASEAHGATFDAYVDKAKTPAHLATGRRNGLRQAIPACRKGGVVSIERGAVPLSSSRTACRSRKPPTLSKVPRQDGRLHQGRAEAAPGIGALTTGVTFTS
jgi:hypothetical protein